MYDPLTMTWTLPCGETVPAWRLAARGPYPGVREQRAMEYMATPNCVASGRERLGE
jgi:hypothetical protein